MFKLLVPSMIVMFLPHALGLFVYFLIARQHTFWAAVISAASTPVLFLIVLYAVSAQQSEASLYFVNPGQPLVASYLPLIGFLIQGIASILLYSALFIYRNFNGAVNI